MPKGAPGARPAAVREAAERILAARDHGRAELRRKLLRRGFDAAEVERALDGLASEGLLDDGRFAAACGREALGKGHGLNYIRAKLRARGLTEPPGCSAEDEAESLRAYLGRRGVVPSELTAPAEKAKMLRFLAGRGYTARAIARVFGWTVASDGADQASGP